jgi:hypothetical protein
MALDSFTEVTRRSWISRLLGSIKSVLFGILLFLGAFVLLFWNEGKAVKIAKGLKEGRGAVVMANADKVDSANDGQLIHLSGGVKTPETLGDSQFGISENALKLKRTVEMYQWVEKSKSTTKKKVGGSEETKTTYSYEKEWSDMIENSKKFKKPEGHQNPAAMPYKGYERSVKKATIGAYDLSESLIYQLFEYDPVDLAGVDSLRLDSSARVSDNTIYIGKGTEAAPEVGDVKVMFSMIGRGDYSVISRQNGKTFEAFNTSYGTKIDMIKKGIHSADGMFTHAEEQNVFRTWFFRFLGWFLMFIGLVLIFKPLAVVADIVPFVGNMLEFGTAVFAGILATALSLMTIAAGWIFYRPLLAFGLLAVGLGIFVFFFMRAKNKAAV